jgi:hypothetical protein
VVEPQPVDGIHAAARAYLARGWSVIAIEPRGKRPRVPWTAFQHRLPTQAELDEWFRRWPDANVGIVTGGISGLVVVDVDPRHGGDRSLQERERACGRIPTTVEAATGGGGRHLYFAHPGGTVGNRVGLAPGIDLRGDGGCVVAPPSMHSSGRRYAWVDGRAPGRCPLAPAPVWIATPAARSGHTPRHWRELVRDGVPEGQRNASLASLAGHLLWHGLDPAVVLELLLAWNRQRCRPPLPDDEVAAVVESIARLHSSASLS